MNSDELKETLDGFLQRWPLVDVESMTLKEYVGLRNKDTFCQWVETQTRMLGSINGMTSIKFGIYERFDKSKRPKNYQNDSQYSWLKDYGSSRKEAFTRTKNELIKIVEYAEKGHFELIDGIALPDIFKWKVAFLYSNERLIPVFKKAVLQKVGEHYGLKVDKHTRVSEIQNVLMVNKPSGMDVYQYMLWIFQTFEDRKEPKPEPGAKGRKTKRRKRKAATGRNTSSKKRTVTRSFMVEQRHNKIQIALEKKLIAEFGKKNVLLEEDFVDVKLFQPKYIAFYEVKSASYASECVKEALGQILLYSFSDTDKRPKKHIVVGQYPPTDNDQEYIDFVKKKLKMEFDYMHVDIDE